MERKMKDKFKCNFEKERSNDVELVASNLEAILNINNKFSLLPSEIKYLLVILSNFSFKFEV